MEGLREMQANGQPGLMAEVLRLFTEQGRMLLEGVRAAALAGQRDQLSNQLHALKGTAGSVGAVLLAERCRQFETGIGSLSRSSALDRVEELAQEFERARAALSQELAAHA
jgi:HPt (histidine-containing phosphotransfer) domain-containing protein